METRLWLGSTTPGAESVIRRDGGQIAIVIDLNPSEAILQIAVYGYRKLFRGLVLFPPIVFLKQAARLYRFSSDPHTFALLHDLAI